MKLKYEYLWVEETEQLVDITDPAAIQEMKDEGYHLYGTTN